MIIALRRNLKSKGFKIIFWVVIIAASGALSLVEFVRSSFFGRGGGGAWVLQVNKEKIFMPEFQRAVTDQEERLRLMRAQYGQYADLYFQMMGIKNNPQELALKSLIRKALLNQMAQTLPLYISSTMIEAQLSNPALLFQELSDLVPFSVWDQSIGGINPLALQAYLAHMGISSTEFNHAIAQAIARNDVAKLVEHAAYVPEFEIREKFAQNFLNHKFSIMTISGPEMLAQVKKEPVSDQKLKSYYDLKNTQEDRYYVPEKRIVKIVTFDPTSYGITLSDEDVEKYYNAHKAEFIDQPAQVQVRRILFKVANPEQEHEVQRTADQMYQELIKNPNQFAAKAQQFSQDSNSASQGGLLPYFSKGTHDKGFEKTSFLLKEDTDISGVIRTKDGYEIVQRVGKKLQTFKPLAQVRKAIADTLIKKKFFERFAGDIRALLNTSDSADAIAKFVQEKHGKESSQTVASDNSVLSKTAFRLKEHETSFYQDPHQGVLVTVTSIKARALPSLDEIKNAVREDYYKDEAAKKISERLEQIEKMGSWEQDKEGAKIEKTGWLRHSADYKEDLQEKKELQKKGIDLGKMFQIENKGGIVTFESNGNGYAVRLDEIAPFVQALFDQKKATTAAEALGQSRSFMVAGLVASLYRNAKIIKNESLIHIES